ncbi:glycoside hydrolase family protein [Tichowtungia aerotolerans]|uniref:Uncharacterized protein n=1 Tax=Tichowtungia aerotolerans TaxID=2697043 RepID=A0A6P1M7F0_9BACT|nr:hypothetical protein [Tichowtungia aerotolerans]QHI69781.1 hypothetical protein GT409_10080 [Tichowtungia aerotolerans]
MTAASWSLGVLSENDTVYFSEDGWTVRNEVAATAASGSVGLTHVFFNSNIANDFRLFSNSDSARLRVTGRIRILEGVTGKVNLDGRWNFRDTDLNVDHYGNNTLEISWMMEETSGTPNASLNYYGNNMNPIVIRPGTAGTGKSDYTGRTALGNVDVELSVVADAAGGGLGLGADIRLNNARLALIDGGTLSNDQVTITGSTSVFDVSGRTTGGYSYNGVLRGFSGKVVGNLSLSGELRAGDETGGIGTLAFEDELEIASGCSVYMDLTNSVDGAFDVLSGNGTGVLAVDSGSTWVFDFSGWDGDELSNGTAIPVLSDWAGISGASVNITTVDLPSGYDLDTSVLFDSGTVTMNDVGGAPAMDIVSDRDQVVICLDGGSGRTYTVQKAADLVGGGWSNTFFGVLEDGQVRITNHQVEASAFFKTLVMNDVSYLGEMDGFYRNRRLLDRILDSGNYLLTIPDWLRDSTLDFHYTMKSNDLVSSSGREIFMADNLNLVRVLGGWITNSTNPTIEDVKQYDLFYLDDFGEAAYRWNLLDDRIDPLIARGYACSNITLVLDNIPYDLAEQVEIGTYGQCGIPSDFTVWGEFIRQMSLRLQSNYGNDANGFRFRIGTESQSAERFQGLEEDYFKFYDYAETAIKSVLSGASVGPFNRAQVGDPSDDIISVQRLAEHCASGTNSASGAIGSTFDWVAHSFYFLANTLHPDDFVPVLNTLYNDVQAVDESYHNLPLEVHEFGPLVTEGYLVASDTGVRGAAQILETLVDLRKIGMDRSYEYKLEEPLVQAEGKVLIHGIGWLYCIFDHLRGGPSWSLPVDVISGSETNSIETLAAVVDDTTYLLVSCWNLNRKVTESSTVTVKIPVGVHSFSEGAQIEQVVFYESNSVYDVIWQDFYDNGMLSAAQISQYENYGKAVTWATTGNGMAADAAAAKQYVIDNWEGYEAVMVDSLDLKTFSGTVQYLDSGEAELTLELPVPSVYVVKMSSD